MARRPRGFAAQILYHVIARGNHLQVTFRTPADYHAYLERLGGYLPQCQVRLWAYCLMPNHVYLLVETGAVPFSAFMQRLQQSYAQYFNRTHRKVGHLFQGRYQAIVCEHEAYLLIRRWGYRARDVAAAFNRDPATLSSGPTRCVVRLMEEPALQRALERLATIIKV